MTMPVRKATPEETARIFGRGRIIFGIGSRPPGWKPAKERADAPLPEPSPAPVGQMKEKKEN